jgi:group I intron endonuclease
MPLIYAILNKSNGYAYVGCTKGKLNKRMREHRCLLNQGKHLATLMQQDWDRDGEEGFTLVELEKLPENASVVDKRVRELYWMQRYQNTLYNAHQVSFAPTPEAIRKGVANAHNEAGNRWTDEVNRKRSEAQKGKPKGHGTKISATKKANAFFKKIGLMR